MSLDKKYKFSDKEKLWEDNWEKSEVYKWQGTESEGEVFVVDTPPPTVSGNLHMGHMFSYIQPDIVVRFLRMFGKDIFYPVGFDDNGLPTERLVEKTKKIKASSLPRDEFRKICDEVSLNARADFRSLFKTVGLSFDWNHEYHTNSLDSWKISQNSFVELYNKGLAYTKYHPIFWDVIDQTAIAQAEIEEKEQEGFMNDITFTAEGEKITIATTRPEMLPACVAVLYHPEDERYKKLAGKMAVSPIFNEEIPLIADDEVDREKGTGLVMCCTFGDIQDTVWWKKHSLPLKQCVNKYGKMENAGFLDGMKVKDAREAILEKLKEAGLLLKQEPVTKVVKCAERSGGILEIIPTDQWFIDVLNHKEQFLKRSKDVTWYPSWMKIRLDNWIDGLNQDWCISRQRFYGVPIPAWYSKRAGEEGKIIVASNSELPVDPIATAPAGYSMDEVKPCKDVFDTWATSALTPELAQFRLKNRLPCDMRPQGHEIIRTWCFVTIVNSHHRFNTIPWKNTMISGWCLAEDKTKMSKSKGNIVSPVELLKQKGADVIRYWASKSRLGADIAYSEDEFKIGQKLINKIWNAARFCEMFISDTAKDEHTKILENIKSGKVSETIDLWVLSELAEIIAKVTESFKHFEYSEARQHAEGFFWNVFCDNYLEFIKKRIYDETEEGAHLKESAVLTLQYVLHGILLLFAPILPHVTEEIYSELFAVNKESIHARGNWFKAIPIIEQSALNEGRAFVKFVELVRKFKSSRNLALNADINMVFLEGHKLSNSSLRDFQNAVNADKVSFSSFQPREGTVLQSECEIFKVRVIKRDADIAEESSGNAVM